MTWNTWYQGIDYTMSIQQLILFVLYPTDVALTEFLSHLLWNQCYVLCWICFHNVM